jgi:large subunit ribosomal protein L17
MRHRKAGRKLKRTASHRRATLSALATSLLRHKRIITTVAKAKETRGVVERLITRAKKAAAVKDAPAASEKTLSEREKKYLEAGGHARREVARMIKDRAVVSELFTTIAEKVATRPGGYTRVVRLGQRPGDGAELAAIELVDFNVGEESAPKKAEKPPKKAQPRKKQVKKSAAKTEKATEQKSAESPTMTDAAPS